MTFNIRFDNPKDEENAWAHRKELVGSEIQFHSIDIVGLQEVLIHQLQDLNELLPEYACIGVGREDGKDSGEFSPIMYLASRLQVLDSGTFWLSETHEIPGSKGWDAANKRICTWAKFLDKQAQVSFYYFNTHFDHKGQIAKRESANLLLKLIQSMARELPVVLTGDFNSTEDSESYMIITDLNNEKLCLRDTRYCSETPHHGPSFTSHFFKAAEIFSHLSKKEYKEINQLPDQIESPIDYIFIKNYVRVKRHGVLSDTWDGIYPSDHMPVVAEIYFL
jgi:endonuclease/exonuclease/phosphatase family metal-dependent hydrolase